MRAPRSAVERLAIAGILLGPPLAWVAGRFVLPLAPALLLLGAGEAGLLLVLRWRRRRALAAIGQAEPRRGVAPEARSAWSALSPWADAEAVAAGRRLRDEADAAAAGLVAAQLQLLSFHDVIRHLTTASGRDQILDALLEHCHRRFGVGVVQCYLPGGGEALRRRELRAKGTELELGEHELPRSRAGALALVLDEGRSLLIGDAGRHRLVVGEEREPAAGYLAVPVPLAPGLPSAAGPSHGALVLWGHVSPGSLDESSRAALEAIGRAAGAVLANAALYERLLAEHALREGILDCLDVGLVAFAPGGRVRFHNRAARDLLGLDEAGMTALTPAALSPDLADPGSPLAGVVAGALPLARADAVVRRADGSPLAVRCTACALAAAPAAAGGLVCALEDLTSVRAMQDQIRQLDKLAAIGRFTSSLAHEIRNPLAGIAAGIEYLRRDGGLGEERQEYIRIISREIDRLDRIIRNLFAVARPGFLMLQRCRLQPVLERVIAGLAPAAEARQVAIAVEPGAAWETIECDEDQVQQVLLNLVKNAIEAEEPGGTVRVVATRGDGPGGGQALTVENGGQTIAPNDRERVFEPFYTRKPEGTGLGLYVSYNIVKQHGGTLEVDNAPAGRTRFRLFLPAKPPRATEAA